MSQEEVDRYFTKMKKADYFYADLPNGSYIVGQLLAK
jgi:hypothetical protein